jgi:hypothetical protein
MSSPRVFDGISRATFEKIKVDLRTLRVHVPTGDACTIEHYGARASLVYSEIDQRMEIQLLDKAFYLRETTAWALLDRALRHYGICPTER